uniref:WD_REPEATS_REGION domain-containing protein n=1 Tax=Angiostrongylus cantonensis TaxID=6313 RepID=A0A0K0CYU3_ANGCA
MCTWVVCRFSPHSETVLYLGDDEGNIGIVDIAPVVSSEHGLHAKTLQCFVAHDATVMDVVGVPNCPDQLLSISGDTTVRLWDLQRQHSTLYFGHEMSVRSVCFVPDNYVFATGGRDGQIRLWDTRTSCFRNQGKLFKKPKAFYVFILSTHSFSGLRLWDTRKFSIKEEGHVLSTLEVPISKDAGITSVCLDRYGSSLFAAVTDNSVYEYGVLSSNRKPIRHFTGAAIESFYVQVQASPVSDFLLCGSKNKHAVMWDLQDLYCHRDECLRTIERQRRALLPKFVLNGHDSEVCCVGWSRTGKLPSVVEFGDSVCSKMLSEQDRALQNSPRKLTVKLTPLKIRHVSQLRGSFYGTISRYKTSLQKGETKDTHGVVVNVLDPGKGITRWFPTADLRSGVLQISQCNCGCITRNTLL